MALWARSVAIAARAERIRHPSRLHLRVNLIWCRVTCHITRLQRGQLGRIDTVGGSTADLVVRQCLLGARLSVQIPIGVASWLAQIACRVGEEIRLRACANFHVSVS